MQQRGIAPNMEALVWRGPRDIELLSESTPQPAPGEALVAVAAVGICGSELSGYLGQNSLRRPPLIMGHEAAGRIVASDEARLADGSPARAGTRVTINPLIVCGACDRCAAGRPLLILGAGPIGLGCLAVARAAGVEHVLVSDLAPRRLDVARRWGAQTVIPAKGQDVVAAVQEAVPGGAAAVIDAVGAAATRAEAVQAVVPGGRVVFIGLHDEESPLAANYLVRQEVTIAGSFAYTDADFARALDLLAQGVVRAEPDWLDVRPLDAGPAAFEELVSGAAAATKIVLIIE